MKVVVIGATGFLGRYVVRCLRDRGAQVDCISLRELNYSTRAIYLEKLITPTFPCDVIVNLAAVKRPFTKFHHFINRDLTNELCNIISAYGSQAQVIHISSLNVLIPALIDAYTVDKRIAEALIVNKKVRIIRPSLIWSWKPEGDVEILSRYFKINFPRHPFPYPGNTYRPVMVHDVAEFIVNEVMLSRNDCVVNLYGTLSVTLWELVEILAARYKRKLIPLKIGYSPAWIRSLFGRHPVFQQLLSISRSEIELTPHELTYVIEFRLPQRI